MSKPFVFDRHGRLFFPGNCLPELSLGSVVDEQGLRSLLAREFEAKAPTGDRMVARAGEGYPDRFAVLRDLTLNLLRCERAVVALYDRYLVRRRDLERNGAEVFIPRTARWRDRELKVASVAKAFADAPATRNPAIEERIFAILFDLYRNRLQDAEPLDPIPAAATQVLSEENTLVECIADSEVRVHAFGYRDIADCIARPVELEPLLRLAMVLHNLRPWDRSAARLVPSHQVEPDDLLVVLRPRGNDVVRMLDRLSRDDRRPPPYSPRLPSRGLPMPSVLPLVVGERFRIQPRIRAIGVAKGELLCTNDDVVRNSAYNWSPMSAEDIRTKTGIESRVYTQRSLAELSLEAATAAVAHSGQDAQRFGAVIFCSSTSTQLMPSVAAWISARLGIAQTHASLDMLAACAGFPYGMAEGIRVLQDVARPVLVVMADKFSDKIGSVRTSRMLFGDGAAAIVIEPAERGGTPDVEVVQTYASGPGAEVDSIVLPNPEFNGDVTVWGPEVRNLVARYLVQMRDELTALEIPRGSGSPLADAIDLTVPHQANRTMVIELAKKAGLDTGAMYFNIARVGNLSAASIPVALHDAIIDGVATRPMRVFTPGFGAGAVAGYTILRLDPAVAAPAYGT